ncbi:hypothetical protein IFM89_033116 [Coptis chinensis]|uniref:SWIM-type domain-containing protein n=1 Tax=Coptis chinensis TaxID=261450 RepID=A0A835HL80_9MAGN|nr:hypothetical protein IFM89_033116 [Coptis chinensis]
MPLVQFVDKYNLMLTSLLHERRRLAHEMTGEGCYSGLVTRVSTIIKTFEKKYNKYEVSGVAEHISFVMTKSGKKWNVDLLKMTCSCCKWQITGIPCVHAVVVIRKRRDKWIQYTSPFFSIDSFKKDIFGYVMPIENVEDLESCISEDCQGEQHGAARGKGQKRKDVGGETSRQSGVDMIVGETSRQSGANVSMGRQVNNQGSLWSFLHHHL